MTMRDRDEGEKRVYHVILSWTYRSHVIDIYKRVGRES